ncbi:MAG: Ig-like domain-containing protein [Promethearchaeota archaeon]
MFFSSFKRRRRGQIRAIDFMVSLFLFILMLSQLILIIFNVQSSIKTSTIRTLAYEEFDIFGRQILFEEGDLNWGYRQQLPSSFGLADSNSQSYLSLDGAKIARLVTRTPLEIYLVSGFYMYDYKTLKEAMSISGKYDFQLGFYPLLNSEISVSDTNFAQVTVTNFYNTPISNARVNFFTIDLTNGEVISEGSTLTDSNGETARQLSNPTLNIPNGEHFVFIIVEKGPLWGMNWGFNDPASDEVFIGSSLKNAIWGGGINSSSLLVSDKLGETPENHFISIIYQDSTLTYSNKTINLNKADDGNETITIPNEGLAAFFSIARNTNNEYHVGIGSYPAILDRDSDSGVFYHIFGDLTEGKRVKSMLSKLYPIIVRGTLMGCQLTLWSE